MQSHYLFFLMFTSSQDNVLLFCGRDYIVVGLTLSSKFESLLYMCVYVIMLIFVCILCYYVYSVKSSRKLVFIVIQKPNSNKVFLSYLISNSLISWFYRQFDSRFKILFYGTALLVVYHSQRGRYINVPLGVTLGVRLIWL